MSLVESIVRVVQLTYVAADDSYNAYSCCRLLWRRDREGRKTLRSAQTGTDHLYNAMEDVWLADVSTNGQYRITQRFFDALGRETNTVVYAGTTPGEATSAAASNGKVCTTVSTAYPHGGSDYAVSTDERGKVTIRRQDVLGDCVETGETVSTNGVEVVKTKSRSHFGGGTSTRREWGGDRWTEERRFDGYLADGRRVAYVVTESSDCGVVTNSVTTYDLLGRVVTTAVPGANGATLVTSNAYDVATARVLASTRHAPGLAPRTTRFLYDGCGEQVGTILDGVTNRTDVSYEKVSNETWRVETSVVVGPSTNSVSIAKTRMTGLSDACRRHVVTVTGAACVTPAGDGISETAGVRAETLVSFDPSTGVETETVTSSAGPTTVRRSRHGLVLADASAGTATDSAYDAFGRVAATRRSVGGAASTPLQSFAYAPCGDLLAVETYTNGTEAVRESYGYDAFGNRTSATNALGQVVETDYDVFGNVTAEWGATYPVEMDYDSQNRRVALRTTRDGRTWDETRWTYDSATGSCTSKTYSDGSTVAYTYTPDNLPLRTTYAGGRWKENVYDARRQVVGVVSGDGAQDIVYVRDAYGRVVSESNAVASAVCSLAASGTATNEAWTVGGDALEIVRSIDPQGRPDGLAVPSSGYSLRHVYADDGNVESISNALAVVEYAYTPDRLDAGYTLTLSNGVAFTRSLLRDGFRRSLVTGVANSVDGVTVEDFDYSHDALGRPVTRNGDAFGYNARGEVVAATVGGNVEAHGYDAIGNSVIAAFNGVTNVCTANGLNQYASIVCASASPCETAVGYDPDGNTTQCGDWTYTYDAANRLKTVSSNGVLLVTNFYDAKGRRVRKVTSESTATFFYDGGNLIEERVANANGTASTIHYYWGKDLSGTLQGAGGVDGLLYLTVDGSIHVPCYDHNGNVTRYLDANGNTVAQYTYDAFGNTISQSGPLADFFRHRFSTKYFDAATGLYYYGHRFYSPVLRRWLNRDPIEEEGGLSLYGFCGNNAVCRYDKDGRAYFAKRQLAGQSWSKKFSINPKLDSLEWEWSHEHLFYGTPDVPSEDIGYFDDGKVRSDKYRGQYKYVVTSSGYNDCVMKKAEERVAPEKYNLIFAFLPWFDNCQSYAAKLRGMYNELLNDERVLCECFGGRKKGVFTWLR